LASSRLTRGSVLTICFPLRWILLLLLQQLFINYGAEYFPAREKDYGPIPLDENYEEGNRLVSRFNGVRRRLPTCINSSSDEEEQTCAATNPALSMNAQSSLLNLIQSLADIWQSRTLKTLPLEPQHVDYVLEHGTQLLYQNRSIQSLEWLQKNGICIDTIQAKRSTIPQAGRGKMVRSSSTPYCLHSCSHSLTSSCPEKEALLQSSSLKDML
jgi:hypothetical protein